MQGPPNGGDGMGGPPPPGGGDNPPPPGGGGPGNMPPPQDQLPRPILVEEYVRLLGITPGFSVNISFKRFVLAAPIHSDNPLANPHEVWQAPSQFGLSHGDISCRWLGDF